GKVEEEGWSQRPWATPAGTLARDATAQRWQTGPARDKKGHEVPCPNREKGRIRTRVENHHLARTRYFRTAVPSLATGTLNCAAKAAVLVYLYVEASISQSPPMGSLTCTVTGASLWLRNVISNSISQVWVSMRL